MKERYLTPKDVAERMGISIGAARSRMMEMPGCIDVGSGGGKYRTLRVPESGLEAWQSNRVVMIQRSTGKIARRPIGRQRRGA